MHFNLYIQVIIDSVCQQYTNHYHHNSYISFNFILSKPTTHLVLLNTSPLAVATSKVLFKGGVLHWPWSSLIGLESPQGPSWLAPYCWDCRHATTPGAFSVNSGDQMPVPTLSWHYLLRPLPSPSIVLISLSSHPVFVALLLEDRHDHKPAMHNGQDSLCSHWAFECEDNGSQETNE